MNRANSHDVLRDEILADAQRQATRLMRKAEREAEALVQQATADSQAERDARLAAARATADQQRALTLATVPVEIRRLRAIRLERELSAVRERVHRVLLAREGLAYPTALVALAVDAIRHMDGSEFVLELSASDLGDFGPMLAERVQQQLTRADVVVRVSPDPAPIATGVLVRDAEGRQVWNNSLDERLQRMWPLLRSRIAELLQGSSSTETQGEPA